MNDSKQPTCETVRVYQTLLEVVNNIQVHEVLRILLGLPAWCVGHLLFIDFNNRRFEQFPITPREDCPVCEGR